MRDFLQNITSYNYWFHLDRSAIHFSDFAFLCIGGILLIGFFVIRSLKSRIKDRDERKVWTRVNTLLAWIGVLLLTWFGLRYQLVGFLGTRFVALMILLSGVAWAFYLKSWYDKKHLTGVAKRREIEAKNKYINA